MTSTRPRAKTGLCITAGLAVASALLLSGCSNGVPAFNPGLAARVGDQTITMNKVDSMSEAFCGAAEQQLQKGQALPIHYLRGQVAGALALRSAAAQLAAKYDTTADPSYDQAVAQAQQQDAIKALPADQVDALIAVQGAPLYVGAVELAVGHRLLASQGKSSPSDDAATAAGQKAFVAWLDDNDVRLDPRFGISIANGQTSTADTSVSFALSDTAKSGDADQPDTTYAASLPEAQRCG